MDPPHHSFKKNGGCEYDAPNNNVDRLQNRNFHQVANKCLAVQVNNANKSYKRGTPILKNFSMKVSQGTIYGLLGASGCGKTTMLSCIVGINKVDSGDLFVFGQRPGTPGSGIPGRRIGYMPQEIALYPQLSIEEIFQYFGELYGMTKAEVSARVEYLMNFLSLPPRTRKIESLSGGQSRRLSLAVSLLHEPPLLILDEPTVGVDPLLRVSIWNHLMELVTQKQITVIITTHYIEEARHSNTVGLMRGGRLLTENAPDVLLEEHNALLLEDIILRLCRMDDNFEAGLADAEDHALSLSLSLSSTKRSNLLNLEAKPKSELLDDEGVTGITFNRKSFKEDSRKDSWVVGQKGLDYVVAGTKEQSDWKDGWGLGQKARRIKAVTIRHALFLIRSPLLIFILLGVPGMNLCFSSLTIGPYPNNLKFGVVNPEMSNNLSLCNFKPNENKCDLDRISCRFIADMPKDILVLESVNSVEEALEGIKNGRLWGYFSFPKAYSNHTVVKMVHGLYAEEVTILDSTVQVRLDESSYVATSIIKKRIYESFQKFARKLLSDCDQDPRKAELAFEFKTPIYSNPEGGYETAAATGVVMVMMCYLGGLYSGASVADDRFLGTLDRTLITGISHFEIMISYFIFNGFIVVVQTAMIYSIMVFGFNSVINGSTATYIALNLLNGVTGLSLGLLFGEIFHTKMEAIMVGVGLFFSSLSSCGILTPLESIPYFPRVFIQLLPYARSIPAIRSIEVRGWSIIHPQVYPAFLLQILWIVGLSLSASILHRIRKS